jgi:hypothetical protein
LKFDTSLTAPVSNRHRDPKRAPQMRVAISNIAWNTGSSSPVKELMTRKTSAVAFSRSIASFSCFVRASSFSCRSATDELPWRAALSALLRLGFVVLPWRAFAVLRLLRGRSTLRSFPITRWVSLCSAANLGQWSPLDQRLTPIGATFAAGECQKRVCALRRAFTCARWRCSKSRRCSRSCLRPCP